MNEIKVLENLKSKIDAAGNDGYNYAIETEDIYAINSALNTPAVSDRWDWAIFVVGFCAGLLLMSIIIFIKNGC